MAQLDASIILGGQGVNALGAIAAGNQAAAQANEMTRQREMNALMQQHGAGIIAGDQNALNALAGFDPMAAMKVQESRLGMDQTRLGMDATRQSMSIMSAQERRAAEEYAAGLSAEARAAEAKQIEDAVKMGLMIPDAATWDQTMGQMAPDMVGQFDQRQALAYRYMDMADVLKQTFPEPLKPTASQNDYMFYVQQETQAGRAPLSFNDWDTQGKKAGATSISVGGAPEVGKLSTDFGYVSDPETRLPVIDPQTGLPTAAPIPGSPAAMDAAAAASKAEVRGAQEANSASIVIADIDKAIGQVSGWTSGWGSMLTAAPGSGAKDLESSLNTIKANIGFDRLHQMREASPTGGALGGIAVQELTMLQAVLGSLDQAQSPEQLQENLVRLKQIYEPIAAKAAAYPNAGDFGFGGQSGAQPAQAARPAQPAQPAQPANKAAYDALPSGAEFIAPDGTTRRKP